jgi:hypothetical protein
VPDHERVESSWVEELYHYAEYYQGERQHIELPLEKARKRMRSTEVPLNAILNITLSLLPASIIERLMRTFLADQSARFGGLALTRPYTDDPRLGHTVQPDVSLQSETARVFIELKVSARFSLEQVQKYVLLHALLNKGQSSSQVPFLFLLSPRQLFDQWKTGDREQLFAGGGSPEDLLDHLKAVTFPEKLGAHELTKTEHEQVGQILGTLRVGATTWQSFGDSICAEATRVQSETAVEAADTLRKLLEDLLAELGHRELWKANQSR